VRLLNTLEGGVDETTISAANSGDASGDAFSSLNIGAGNAAVFDSIASLKGDRAARLDLGASSGTVDQIGWTFGAVAEAWGYFYIYRTATWTGPSTLRVLSLAGAGASTARIVLGRDSPYQLAISDANFANQVATVGGLALSTLYRVGWHVVCSDTVGSYELKYFLGDSDTPVETVQATNVDTNVSIDTVTHGSTTTWSGGAYSFWLDNLNLNTEGLFGPAPGGRQYRRLYGPAQLPAVATTVYTVPTNALARIRNIHAFNPTGSPVTFTVTVGTDAAGTRTITRTLAAGGSCSLRRRADITLAEGEFIQAYASTGSAVVLVIDGVEIPVRR
jgi:hypothetical protein